MEGPLACPTCRKRPHEQACGNRVFAKAHCPCCLETHEPVVALPCGHAVCEDCFGRLGARLVDEDKEHGCSILRGGCGGTE